MLKGLGRRVAYMSVSGRAERAAFSRVLLFTKLSKINIPPQPERKRAVGTAVQAWISQTCPCLKAQRLKPFVYLCRHGQLPVISQMMVRWIEVKQWLIGSFQHPAYRHRQGEKPGMCHSCNLEGSPCSIFWPYTAIAIVCPYK